jgi:hypothetical protein
MTLRLVISAAALLLLAGGVARAQSKPSLEQARRTAQPLQQILTLSEESTPSTLYRDAVSAARGDPCESFIASQGKRFRHCQQEPER